MIQISRIIRYKIACIELFIISFLLLSLDIAILCSKSINIKFLSTIDPLPLYGINYIALYFLFILYKCSKIHRTAKNCPYASVMRLLHSYRSKRGMSLYSRDQHESGSPPDTELCKEHEDLHPYLAYYAWLRNPNSQTALNCLGAGLVLLGVIVFLDAAIPLVLLAFVVGLYTLIKLAQSIMEVV